MRRLLKRRYVQESLKSAEKEMGGRTLTLEELDKLLTEQGIDTKGKDAAFRIATDDTIRLIYVSGMRVEIITVSFVIYIAIRLFKVLSDARSCGSVMKRVINGLFSYFLEKDKSK